jgi:hypothetical protein
VADVAPLEMEAGIAFEMSEIFLVAGREIIDAQELVALAQ